MNFLTIFYLLQLKLIVCNVIVSDEPVDEETAPTSESAPHLWDVVRRSTEATKPKPVHCFECISGKVIVSMSAQRWTNHVQDAQSSYNSDDPQTLSSVGRSSDDGKISSIVVDGRVCNSTHPEMKLCRTKCVAMDIKAEDGNVLGTKKACLDSFLMPYLSYISPGSMASKRMIQLYRERKERELQMVQDARGSSINEDGQNVANDEPFQSSNPTQLAEFRQAYDDVMSEVCGTHDDREIDCPNAYINSFKCRIRCCGNDFCNVGQSNALSSMKVTSNSVTGAFFGLIIGVVNYLLFAVMTISNYSVSVFKLFVARFAQLCPAADSSEPVLTPPQIHCCYSEQFSHLSIPVSHEPDLQALMLTQTSIVDFKSKILFFLKLLPITPNFTAIGTIIVSILISNLI